MNIALIFVLLVLAVAPVGAVTVKAVPPKVGVPSVAVAPRAFPLNLSPNVRIGSLGSGSALAAPSLTGILPSLQKTAMPGIDAPAHSAAPSAAFAVSVRGVSAKRVIAAPKAAVQKDGTPGSRASSLGLLRSVASGLSKGLRGPTASIKTSAGTAFDGSVSRLGSFNLHGKDQGDPTGDGADFVSDSPPGRESYPIIGSGAEFIYLRQFAKNVTEQAVNGELEPVIGRNKEADRAAMVLLRRKKNNPVFIGPAGVGKTVMATSLAQRIVDGDFPELWGKNIFELDTMALESRSENPAEFSMNLRRVLQEVIAAEGKIILFIDELHTLIGLGGSEGTRDAAQLLKNALASGELTVIGTTSDDEYRDRIEKDPRLERRFEPIYLKEPSPKEAVEILEGIKHLYEDHHHVEIPQETTEAAARMGKRYLHGRHLPDSAIDLIDDASGKVQMEISRKERDSNVVTPDDVAQVVYLRTGIPVHQASKSEAERLRGLPERLNQRVVRQPHAVQAVYKAIRRARLGHQVDRHQPVGTFVFLGPTGVGKTELAKALAEEQFDSQENMLTIDMSEYKTTESVYRLIGAPPGSEGYDGQPGLLTEAIRRNPHTLILLDEVEEAHPAVMDLLLQLVDEGRLAGVDFSNTILIMTSNVGGTLAEEGEPEEGEDYSKRYIEALRKKIKPKLFNRIGEENMLVFNSLDREGLQAILGLRFTQLRVLEATMNLILRLGRTAMNRLLDVNSTPEKLRYGARPLLQAFNQEIGDALSEAQDRGEIGPGSEVIVEYDKSSERFVVNDHQPHQ